MTVYHTHHLLIDGPLCPFGDVSKHDAKVDEMARYLIQHDGHYTDEDALRSLLWSKKFQSFDVLVLALSPKWRKGTILFGLLCGALFAIYVLFA